MRHFKSYNCYAAAITIKCEMADKAQLKENQLNEERPHIHISIQDNGIGFEQEYAEQIFVIFQRLNDMYTYGGTGIGLALCRKITLNHSGSIYAKGLENNGAIFHILLPVKQVLQ